MRLFTKFHLLRSSNTINKKVKCFLTGQLKKTLLFKFVIALDRRSRKNDTLLHHLCRQAGRHTWLVEGSRLPQFSSRRAASFKAECDPEGWHRCWSRRPSTRPDGISVALFFWHFGLANLSFYLFCWHWVWTTGVRGSVISFSGFTTIDCSVW